MVMKWDGIYSNKEQRVLVTFNVLESGWPSSLHESFSTLKFAMIYPWKVFAGKGLQGGIILLFQLTFLLHPYIIETGGCHENNLLFTLCSHIDISYISGKGSGVGVHGKKSR
jgi:hypothetical protein